MSLIKRMSEEDKERFEIFSRLPNDEKVKLIMKYQKRIDKAIEYIENPHHEMSVLTYQNLLTILRGDSDENKI